MSPVLIALGQIALKTLMAQLQGGARPKPVDDFIENIRKEKAEFPGNAVIQALPNDAAGLQLLHREIELARTEGRQALDDIDAIRARRAAAGDKD